MYPYFWCIHYKYQCNMLQQDVLASSPLRGKLCTSSEVDSYERAWHDQIFVPRWTSLKKEVTNDLSVVVHAVLLVADLFLHSS